MAEDWIEELNVQYSLGPQDPDLRRLRSNFENILQQLIIWVRSEDEINIMDWFKLPIVDRATTRDFRVALILSSVC